MSGIPWVPDEDDMLLREAKELQHDLREVASRLNFVFDHRRTQRSVRGRLQTLHTGPVKYIAPGASGSPWSREDEDRLLVIAFKGRNGAEVAQEFPGRTRKAVVVKLRELRARPEGVPPSHSIERRCLWCRAVFRSPDRRRRWLCDLCGMRAECEGSSIGG